MNLPWNIIFFCLVLICSNLSALAGELPPNTKRNPFKPPAHFAQLKEPQAHETRAVDLVLRATMITHQWTMANVNGTMLVPGETIDDYRLLQVRENEVVFVKDGEQIVVGIDYAN